ncbi:NSS family neurotransmitter:Na+ symporter [Methanococcus voltae]|uniref:sodium-dependent transporter n=1 Tax=Methanococcus voltae TaxID=2188 RepID=UPI001AE5DB71|nr:NSS family neurotransmitter:Na+ symporter [Methanococcus voltae]
MSAREQWGSNLGFIIAAIGSAVGLGNIWRFPYMAYENGGGAFLIPYLIGLFVVGVTVLALEFVIGHSTKGSAPLAWKRLNGKFEWLGWLSVFTAFVITTYYMAILGWGIAYLYQLLFIGIPADIGGFFFNEILQISSGPAEIGTFPLLSLVSVVLAWVVTYVIINSGVKKGLERANKIFMPILFLMTVALVIRGFTLPGGIDGILLYVTPDFSKITNLKIWVDAFCQIFFSLSLGFGIMIAYSSYLPEKTDLTKSSLIVALSNSFYSLIVGLAVFGTLGYMAFQQNIPITEVVQQSITLAFVTFPTAISLMPFGREFGIIFFLSFVIAGISSALSLMESFSSAIIDKFQIDRKKTSFIVTILGILGSLIFVTQSGLYWLDIVDNFISNVTLPLVGILEAIAAIWLFKGEKLVEYIDRLSPIKMGSLWKVFAGIITPASLLVFLGFHIHSLITTGYGGYESIFVALGAAVIPTMLLGSIICTAVPWKEKIQDWDSFNYDRFKEIAKEVLKKEEKI